MRLFTALWPPDPVRAAIANWQARWEWPRAAAPVRPERLHITLHFLGEVPVARFADLARALRVPFEPFELALGTGEVWPSGVAVLQPHAVPPALARLHAALGARLAMHAWPLDARPYRPHVTLARRAHGARPPPEGPGLRWPAGDGYVLVRSLPGGAGYEVIERLG
jgi:RNA 2',3'-cyclic 3'-phosphodiesterase